MTRPYPEEGSSPMTNMHWTRPFLRVESGHTRLRGKPTYGLSLSLHPGRVSARLVQSAVGSPVPKFFAGHLALHCGDSLAESIQVVCVMWQRALNGGLLLLLSLSNGLSLSA